MKILIKDGVPTVTFLNDVGDETYISVNKALLNLSDYEFLIDIIANYCSGKRTASIRTLFTPLSHFFIHSIELLCINELPSDAEGWKNLIRQTYISTLTSELSKAGIASRTKMWNTVLIPFFEYLRDRGIIPLSVRAPRMKKVGELKVNSAFKVSTTGIIGEATPTKDNSPKFITKTLTPIGLHRTDADYLDEIRFDLTRKRDGLYVALNKYWEAIKVHYEYGKSIILTQEEYDSERFALYRSGEKYLRFFSMGKAGKMIPRKKHIADPCSYDGFRMYLYLVHKNANGAFRQADRAKIGLPKQSISQFCNNYFPSHEIENNDVLSSSHRLNWAMGLLEVSDCSVLMALLMMDNPSWTIDSLREAKVFDSHGSPILQISELGYTFEIDKERAKKSKKERLSDLSYEIITFLIEIRELRHDLISKGKENYLFLSRSNNSSNNSIPGKSNISTFMSGKSTSQTPIYDYFPSLKKLGIEKGTIGHGKIRHTEGVLEWFRTGSLKQMSKVLGNSNKVTLTHYIPKPLLAAWSTRQVRRFQNLMIIAATVGEDYQLEAVDFHNLSELNEFVVGILTDETNKSPLIEYLRAHSNVKNKEVETPSGKVLASISETSLTALYCYQQAALNSNVKPEALTVRCPSSDFSPMALINLANHLNAVLPNDKESKTVLMHIKAKEKSFSLMDKLNWADMFTVSGVI